MKVMRTIQAGLAVALVGSVLLAPLAAAGRQNGVISGSAASEVKTPYTQYIIRARDVNSNQFQTTTLDANAEFAVNGLSAATYMIELVKGAEADGSRGKIICTAGPFTLQDSGSQVADLMIKKGANVHCNRPMAAYWLLGAAAVAGVSAGIAAGGTSSPSQ
jgi:hypothetical protein